MRFVPTDCLMPDEEDAATFEVYDDDGGHGAPMLGTITRLRIRAIVPRGARGGGSRTTHWYPALPGERPTRTGLYEVKREWAVEELLEARTKAGL